MDEKKLVNIFVDTDRAAQDMKALQEWAMAHADELAAAQSPCEPILLALIFTGIEAGFFRNNAVLNDVLHMKFTIAFSAGYRAGKAAT